MCLVGGLSLTCRTLPLSMSDTLLYPSIRAGDITRPLLHGATEERHLETAIPLSTVR